MRNNRNKGSNAVKGILTFLTLLFLIVLLLGVSLQAFASDEWKPLKWLQMGLGDDDDGAGIAPGGDGDGGIVGDGDNQGNQGGTDNKGDNGGNSGNGDGDHGDNGGGNDNTGGGNSGNTGGGDYDGEHNVTASYPKLNEVIDFTPKNSNFQLQIPINSAEGLEGANFSNDVFDKKSDLYNAEFIDQSLFYGGVGRDESGDGSGGDGGTDLDVRNYSLFFAFDSAEVKSYFNVMLHCCRSSELSDTSTSGGLLCPDGYEGVISFTIENGGFPFDPTALYFAHNFGGGVASPKMYYSVCVGEYSERRVNGRIYFENYDFMLSVLKSTSGLYRMGIRVDTPHLLYRSLDISTGVCTYDSHINDFIRFSNGKTLTEYADAKLHLDIAFGVDLRTGDMYFRANTIEKQWRVTPVLYNGHTNNVMDEGEEKGIAKDYDTGEVSANDNFILHYYVFTRMANRACFFLSDPTLHGFEGYWDLWSKMSDGSKFIWYIQLEITR